MVFSLGGLAVSARANAGNMLIIGRIVTGLGFGGQLGSTVVLVQELAPRSMSGRVVSLLDAFTGIAVRARIYVCSGISIVTSGEDFASRTADPHTSSLDFVDFNELVIVHTWHLRSNAYQPQWLQRIRELEHYWSAVYRSNGWFYRSSNRIGHVRIPPLLRCLCNFGYYLLGCVELRDLVTCGSHCRHFRGDCSTVCLLGLCPGVYLKTLHDNSPRSRNGVCCWG
ncbi:hypothetical protein JG688_00011164 [Phytophthora aleatoria]|uniref:Uncharacterized protein n=1 Tax=Phytophthora aleatoria TaxID=2496075 RepID=A0A8J5IH87_9STRA|nr:hypothetical protein JG688_00011164 [Phytophthora aleatoria]